MVRTFILTLIFAIILSGKAYTQSFNELTSKIFFNVDLKNKFTTLIADFNSNPDLTSEKNTGWTVYPPTDDKGNVILYHTYTFSQHPYFLSKLNNAQLIVLTTTKSDSIPGMILSLSFESQLAFDSTYKAIKNSYKKVSLKAIKRPHTAQPYETTKFLSKDNKGFVIITKGNNDKGFYLHIAFNYQDYDW